jgi:hypothetical protein
MTDPHRLIHLSFQVVSFASLPPELIDLIAEYVGAVEGDGRESTPSTI